MCVCMCGLVIDLAKHEDATKPTQKPDYIKIIKHEKNWSDEHLT